MKRERRGGKSWTDQASRAYIRHDNHAGPRRASTLDTGEVPDWDALIVETFSKQDKQIIRARITSRAGLSPMALRKGR